MQYPIFYFQCFSGISGDMTVAALLDLGADARVLKEGLESLHIDGYTIKIGTVTKCGVSACDFHVILEQNTISTMQYEHHHDHGHIHEHHNHGHIHEQEHHHNHEYIHEQEHHLNHGHTHEQEHLNHEHIHEQEHHLHHGHIHEQEHHHNHKHHHSHSFHRTLADILPIIDQSTITPSAKALAKKIFHIVAEAEAKAHHVPLEQVHFHEVGAIDSIVDIVGAAICLDNLGIQNAVFSPIYEGTGHVHCQHGSLPVPVPAVVNIAEKYHIPLHFTQTPSELVTPTGIAIAAALYDGTALPAQYSIKKTGIGAGKKDLPHANLLRIFLLEDASQTEEALWALETNVDDATGECLGFVLEKLLSAGANDAFFTPIYGKKNRPAFVITVLCSTAKINEMEHILFMHTTTIGIRRYALKRTALPRETKTIATPYGNAIVKKVQHNQSIYYYPEYQSVKELAEQNHMDFQTVYHTILCSAKENHV